MKVRLVFIFLLVTWQLSECHRVRSSITFHSIKAYSKNFQSKKYTKVTCRASGKSVTHIFNRIKPYSRNYSVLNLGFDVIRKLDKISVSTTHFILIEFFFLNSIIKLDYEVQYKYLSSNWRRIFIFPNLDACNIIASSSKVKSVEIMAAAIFKSIQGLNQLNFRQSS